VGWLGYNRIGFPSLPGFETGGSVAGTDPALSSDNPLASATGQENPPTTGENGQPDQTGAIVANTPVPPTPTLPPPPPTLTPAPSPTPVMIEQKIATVAHPYGVNARSEPNTLPATVLRIIPEGETGIVLEERDDWLKILLSEDGEVWVSSQFMDLSTELVEQVDPASPQPSGDASVQITAPAGLNARSAPVDGADVVQYLLADTVVPAVTYSDDSQWIMVELESGQMGWVFAEYVNLTGRIGIGLPELQEEPQDAQVNDTEQTETELGEAEQTEAELAGVASTDGGPTTDEPVDTNIATDSIVTVFPGSEEVAAQDIITTGVALEPPFTNIIPLDSPAVIIDRDQGTNARAQDRISSDELLLLPKGAVLPILGKNAAGDWVQIALPGDGQGWVFAQGVGTTQPLDVLPVIDPDVPAEVDEQDVTESASADEEAEDSTEDEVSSVETNATARTLLAIYPTASNLQKPLDVILNGEALAVIGRSADSRWVQIDWKKADSDAWILVAGVTLDVDIETLPVVE